MKSHHCLIQVHSLVISPFFTCEITCVFILFSDIFAKGKMVAKIFSRASLVHGEHFLGMH